MTTEKKTNTRPRRNRRRAGSLATVQQASKTNSWDHMNMPPNKTIRVARASVNYRDLLSVLVQYERYRDGGCGQPTEDQLFIGVKVGSRPGIITGLVGSVIAGIIIAIEIAGIEN